MRQSDHFPKRAAPPTSLDVTHLRRLLAICLALTLVGTSGAMAVARGQMAADPGTIAVICVGSETETLRLDAEGNPVHASHTCPDCALIGLAAVTLRAQLAADPAFGATSFRPRQSPCLWAQPPEPGGAPRAPPEVI